MLWPFLKHDFNPKIFRELLIEPTSKCALACSRCDRTMFPQKFRATELPLELLKERLTPQWLRQISVFHLNGTYGEPIFHSQFHEMISFLKSEGSSLKMDTCGYGQAKEWWRKLRPLLTRKDRVTFSIDGLEDTNHLYRKGAKWANIMDAVESVKGTSTLIWKFIIFKHNEHQIEEARQLAKDLGFDEFRLVRSNRFGPYWHKDETDALEPSSEFLGDRLLRTKKGGSTANKLAPRCLKSARLPTISYDGHLFPCCWMVSHYQNEAAIYGEGLESISLHSHTLEACFNSPLMKRLAAMFSDFDSAPQTCQLLCRKADVVKEHSFTQNSETIYKVRPTFL